MIRAAIMGIGSMLLEWAMTLVRNENSTLADKQSAMIRMENINDFGTMRYWNLTYNDPGRWAEVHAIAGAPLNFFQSIKAGGTGSPRAMLTKSGNVELDELLDSTSVIKYCNFERTSNGMVMYVRVRLEV